MGLQSKSADRPSNSRLSSTGQENRKGNGEQFMNWQTNLSQSSTPATLGNSGGGRRGDKKPEHKFSSSAANSGGYTMQQFMRESQGPRGTAPWTPVWTFPKSMGDQKKKR